MKLGKKYIYIYPVLYIIVAKASPFFFNTYLCFAISAHVHPASWTRTSHHHRRGRLWRLEHGKFRGWAYNSKILNSTYKDVVWTNVEKMWLRFVLSLDFNSRNSERTDFLHPTFVGFETL